MGLWGPPWAPWDPTFSRKLIFRKTIFQNLARRDGKVEFVVQNPVRRDGKVEFVIQNPVRRDGKVELLIQNPVRRDGQVEFVIQDPVRRHGQVEFVMQNPVRRDGKCEFVVRFWTFSRPGLVQARPCPGQACPGPIMGEQVEIWTPSPLFLRKTPVQMSRYLLWLTHFGDEFVSLLVDEGSGPSSHITTVEFSLHAFVCTVASALFLCGGLPTHIRKTSQYQLGVCLGFACQPVSWVSA